MNKPDTWMPFYGHEFFQAAEGMTPAVAYGYLRAIWHYWSHTHGGGLNDNSDELMRICRIDPKDWPDAQGVIFHNDQFFTQDNRGRWHQNRAAELYELQVEKYQKASEDGKKGAAKRWNRHNSR